MIDQTGNETAPQSQQTSASHECTLSLRHRSCLRDLSAYVAVSYCWKRELVWPVVDDHNAHEVFCEDLSKRHTIAPYDILCRSITYAKAHGVHAVWIDQECIDQSDTRDKEAAIQEMDIVYQDSDHPIAVLEYCFQTQTEIDVFTSICDIAYFTFDPSQIDILENVLSALVDDEWFARAWTLQESVSAGVSMTLLLGCPGLQKSPHFGPTPDDVEISIWDFQNAMVWTRGLIEESLTAGIWPDTESAINASNYADILWNYLPTILPHDSSDRLRRNPSHRQVCNAAQGMAFLKYRGISLFPDELAILANLCNYDYRINTKVLEPAGSSFSICALTLAIVNGDMSLLGGYEAQNQRLVDHSYDNPARSISLAKDGRSIKPVYENDDHDIPSNAYGFSWGPKPSASLQNINYLEEDGRLFRLKPSTLSKYGLRVCGVLWSIDCIVYTPRTQQEFSVRWQEELALQLGENVLEGKTRQTALTQEFSWSLLNELVELDFDELARSIWNFVQPLGRDPISGNESYGLSPPYSFDYVFGHLLQGARIPHLNFEYDEHEIQGRLAAPYLSFDPENEAFDRPNLQRLLIDRVCKEGALICGTPIVSPHSIKKPRVWFEACKMGDQIFTPVTNLGDSTTRSRYRNEAMSWRVSETGKSTGDCEILHCFGRRRGIWRTEGLCHEDYVLE
ncbi:MAG: hypothetical protein LQ351_000254 [Letrouitia transgressa]|nr:MAG: hypothetical protein LQ351_000254 [Letrouitia transgressa]